MGGRTFCSQRMLSQPLLSASTHLSSMHVDKSLSFTHFLVISQLWLNIHIFPQSTSNFATGSRKRSGTTITSSGSAPFGCTPVTVFRVGRSEIGKFKRTFGQLVPISANLEENILTRHDQYGSIRQFQIHGAHFSLHFSLEGEKWDTCLRPEFDSWASDDDGHSCADLLKDSSF